MQPPITGASAGAQVDPEVAKSYELVRQLEAAEARGRGGGGGERTGLRSDFVGAGGTSAAAQDAGHGEYDAGEAKALLANAEGALRELIARRPRHADAHAYLGMALHEQGSVSDVVDGVDVVDVVASTPATSSTAGE